MSLGGVELELIYYFSVKNVSVSITTETEELDKGSNYTFTFLATGYRPAHSISITRNDDDISDWTKSTNCSKNNNLEYQYKCTYTISAAG